MSAKESDRLFEWLLVNGGPVVRFRTANELCCELPPVELERMERELLAAPPVEQWLSRLDLGDLSGELDRLTPAELARLGVLVHGSKPNALENVLGRLNELGLRAGCPVFDRRMLPLMRIFRWQGNLQSDAWHSNARHLTVKYLSTWESLVKSIFAWGLLRGGYRPDPAMQDYLCALIDINHKIARDRVYDIYATGSELNGLPRAWAGKPILKQEVMAKYHLPLVHDLYVLANLPAWMVDETIAAKINDIIRYVLDPRFQAFAPGYGYAWIQERRTCYSWGWSPHLAGFVELNWQDHATAGMLIQQMELMANFPAARNSRWFQSGLRHLEFFRDDEGIYQFPSHYLRDGPAGYYVSGSCMGLGENRRLRKGLQIESTFRMCRIRAGWDCFDRIML